MNDIKFLTTTEYLKKLCYVLGTKECKINIPIFHKSSNILNLYSSKIMICSKAHQKSVFFPESKEIDFNKKSKVKKP